MNRFVTFLTGAQLGFGLMYVLDPDAGKRRRAQLRDKGVHLGHELQDGLRKSTKDLKHRSFGRFAEFKGKVRREHVSDEVLHERVRSTIGRCTRNPGAIEVHVNDGRVTLTGPILASELDEVISGVRGVRGVESVRSRLELHETADIPGLQGEGKQRARRAWRPATRLVAGTAGAACTIGGLSRRGAEGIALASIGGLLLTRSLTNIPLIDIVGLSQGRRRLVTFQKSIVIDAPVDEVFPVFSNFENWPRFMAHVLDVQDLGDGRSHWVYDGPAGLSVEWQSELERVVPNELLSWKSVRGSTVGHTGYIRFQRSKNDRTRIHVRLAYYPPGGALGHVVATLFGSNPKRVMNQDLLRLKTLLEEGRTRVPGQGVETLDTLFASREADIREPIH